MTEPWLRGMLTDVPSVPRAVLHALQLAEEDLEKWCGGLSDEQLWAEPMGLPPVGFHLRHIARSLDRLLTYAEGRQLEDRQLQELRSEAEHSGSREQLFGELRSSLTRSAERIRRFDPDRFGDARLVGKKGLPTTLGGLLVHVADHTQRHVGQAITTAKAVARNSGGK